MWYSLNLFCSVLVVLLINHFHLTGFTGWFIGYLQGAIFLGLLPMLELHKNRKA